MDETSKMIGSHEARLIALESNVVEIKNDVKSILDKISQVKGGWKVVILISGASAVVGASTSKLISMLAYLPFK